MAAPPLRVAVIDDSALYRQMLLHVLGRLPGVEVVGTAANGIEGVELVARTKPDLVTLDVQMPGMDGIEVLREFRRRGLRVRTIMVSSLTAGGAPTTVAALMEGAFDYVLKPLGSFAHENREQLHADLGAKVAAIRDGAAGGADTDTPASGDPATSGWGGGTPRHAAIAIGTSTGGPQALRIVVPRLPADLPVPVLIVQHIPAEFSSTLAARLASISPAPVVEAADGMTAVGGRVYLAPGGRHLGVEMHGTTARLRLDDGPPRKGCRPSFDHLLETAAEAYRGRVLAAVLTGMGSDGLEGCRRLKGLGGHVIAEDASTCVVYGMPKAVIEAGLADDTVPLPGIAACLLERLQGPATLRGRSG
ncbi:MAG: protein-glutamate methylesterase/protein-glutamine glutaminase [Pirellulales bacterium]